jgi:hypothetical protein
MGGSGFLEKSRERFNNAEEKRMGFIILRFRYGGGERGIGPTEVDLSELRRRFDQ